MLVDEVIDQMRPPQRDLSYILADVMSVMLMVEAFLLGIFFGLVI